jgi:hypothetical protein
MILRTILVAMLPSAESMKRKWAKLVGATQVKQRSDRDAIRVLWGKCVRGQKKYE